MRNIEFYTAELDVRPVFYLEDVSKGQFENIDVQVHVKSTIFQALDVKDIYISNPWPSNICEILIDLRGNFSKNIRLDRISNSEYKKIFVASEKFDESEVRITLNPE